MTDMPQHTAGGGDQPERTATRPHSRSWWIWILVAILLTAGILLIKALGGGWNSDSLRAE
jgi:hypothetical protein